MQIRSVVVVASLGLASFVHGQQAVQWRVEDGGNGHWYRHESQPMLWDLAQARAEQLGGYLVSFRSAPEFVFVRGALQLQSTFLWIGAFQPPGSCEPACGWQWASGEPWDYAPWYPGEPNNFGEEHWIICYPWDGSWNDADASPRETVYEWSADCNGDGIVDYGQCRDGSLPDYDGNNVPDCCEAGTPCTVGNYPVQWRVDDGGNGHWYQGFAIPPSTTRTWADSRDVAISSGGDLAAFSTSGEANWVYANIASNLALWDGDFGPYIGLYQLNGTAEPGGGWVWVDGTPNTGTVAWYWNQPDNFAAPCGGDQFAAYWTGGPWFPSPRNYIGDISGSGYCCCEPGVDRTPSFLVEWSADCNSDGIVDYGQILDGTFEDINQNGVPDICEVDPCPGDITGGGQVNGVDLAAILGAWGTDGLGKLDSDINDDGTVDAQDLAIVLGGWGNCP